MAESSGKKIATIADTQGALPPAGFMREEVLAKREDELAEKAEKQGDNLGAINPEAFDIDRELAQVILDSDYMKVTNEQAGRRYKWVCVSSYGRFVTEAKAKGWQPVQGKDPECREYAVGIDSLRQVGDVILMWTSEENFQKWERIDRVLRQRQQEGGMEGLIELTPEAQKRGIIINTQLDQASLDRLGKVALAKQIAQARFDQHLRAGTVGVG